MQDHGVAERVKRPARSRLFSRASAAAVQRSVAHVESAVDRGAFWFASSLLLVFTICLFLQVLFRYVIKLPVPWTEEAARFALVWFSLVAAAIAAREGQHFIFRWATRVLPEGIRFWLRRTVDVLVLAMLLEIFRDSLNYLSVVSNQTAPGTGINMQWAYGGISFGAAMLAIIYICELVDALASLITHQRFSRREVQEENVHAMLAGTINEGGQEWA